MDFIKILRKQFVFPVDLIKPYLFHPPSSTHGHLGGGVFMASRKAVPPQQGRWSLYAHPHTNSIYLYSSLRRARIQGPLRPVLVTRPTSTPSRGDQYCFLLVTSTGSIADQYWSQSSSSKSICNYLCTRPIHIPDLGTSTALKRGLAIARKAPHTF